MGSFPISQVPVSAQEPTPVSPEILLGGQASAQGTDPSRDTLRTLISQAASLQQQFMELFQQYPATAKYLRQIQDAVRGALMTATQPVTKNREAPSPPMMG